MSEPKVPDAWVGQRVEALIVQAAGLILDEAEADQEGGPLIAWPETGTLESVNDRGIVATFEEEDGPAASAFYPWSAVLRLRPV